MPKWTASDSNYFNFDPKIESVNGTRLTRKHSDSGAVREELIVAHEL